MSLLTLCTPVGCAYKADEWLTGNRNAPSKSDHNLLVAVTFSGPSDFSVPSSFPLFGSVLSSPLPYCPVKLTADRGECRPRLSQGCGSGWLGSISICDAGQRKVLDVTRRV
eukprot:COSAG02_NODE_344_length_24146_cov_12.795983_17_plen_111_part_00